MRRFSIAWLMAVVMVCGVAVAALRDASDAWAGALLLLTLFLLGSSLLDVLRRRDAKRAFWQGFALFGWGYLILAQAPWFDEKVQPRLPTTHALNYAQGKLNSSPNVMPVELVLDASTFANTPSVTITAAPQPGGSPPVPTGMNLTNTQPAQSGQVFRLISSVAFPGTGNLEHFRRVGHCLFALVAALIGAAVSRWFHRSGRSAATPA
jgi:hypothetical protein